MVIGVERRRELDKFYTPSQTVKACLDIFLGHVVVEDGDIIIEPSAGNGSFFIPLSEKFGLAAVCAYDIEPEHEHIIKADYLQLPNPPHPVAHVIGNPPFGRQNKLAKQFIQKSAEFAATISFILPISFKREGLKKTFPYCFHLVTEQVIEKSMYLLDNAQSFIPTVFQVWKRHSRLRITQIPIRSSVLFSFVKNQVNSDFSIRRVGANAGEISLSSDTSKCINTHFFIKINQQLLSLDSFLEQYKKIHIDALGTGPKSINRVELCSYINQLEY